MYGAPPRKQLALLGVLVVAGFVLPRVLPDYFLYVGNLLIWLGFVIGSGLLWFLPIAIVLFAIEYSFIVRYEEGVLESIFGEEYLAYKRRTPRWMPRISSSSSGGDSYAWGEAWRSEISTFLQYAVLSAAFIVKSRYFGR